MYFSVGASEWRAELSVKHSKFLAFCSSVSDEEQAEEFVRSIKKRYTDATHAPYAYLLGERADKFRASDDGEPSGTSGVPILESIKKAGLTFTAVVVVRYFGGIKLGTGGLARAYGDAAEAALSLADRKAFERCVICEIACDYPLISVVQNQVFSFGGILLGADYSSGAVLTVAVPCDKKSSFYTALADASSGKATITEKEEKYCEVKYVG